MAEEDFIRKSTVCKNTDLNVGSQVYEELNDEVEYLLEQAEARAEANGRRTIKARDV